MPRYEIEIKSLLGARENAEKLREDMQRLDPDCSRIGQNRQLNHYFVDGDIHALATRVQGIVDPAKRDVFAEIVERGSAFSLRTRQKDDQVFLVLKASVDAGTSANAVSRMEFEEPVLLTLDALDALMHTAGFAYQAKWSREREEYAYKGATVCLDRNAGYGYLAEFEKMSEEEHAVPAIRRELESLMDELGVVELPQDRLERMFAHYNAHWPEYYGTDEVFVIE